MRTIRRSRTTRDCEHQATGRWNLLQATGTGPAGVQSVSVEIQVTKLQAGGTFTAYLDNLSLVTSPR